MFILKNIRERVKSHLDWMSISRRWPWEGYAADYMDIDSVRPVRPSNSVEQNLFIDVDSFGDNYCVIPLRNGINWSQVENAPALTMAWKCLMRTNAQLRVHFLRWLNRKPADLAVWYSLVE